MMTQLLKTFLGGKKKIGHFFPKRELLHMHAVQDQQKISMKL
jgi:hypothetical protein